MRRKGRVHFIEEFNDYPPYLICRTCNRNDRLCPIIEMTGINYIARKERVSVVFHTLIF